MIWKIFLVNRKKNTSLASCILLFNLAAALLEGCSFVLLLASFTVLTGETVANAWIRYLPFGTTNPFLSCLLSAIVLQMCRSLGIYLGQLMTNLLTLNVQYEIQRQIFSRIFTMSFRDVAQFQKGDLMHLATSPSSFIPLLFDEYNRFITCLMMFIAYLGLMARISLTLTCFNMALFALAICIQRIFFGKIMRASQQHAQYVSQLSQQTTQSLDGIKVVHLFQRQQHTLGQMKSLLHKISKATLGMKKWNAFIPCLNESIGIILVGLSLVLGVWILQQQGQPYTAMLFVYLTLTYRLGIRLQQMMSAKGVMSSYHGQIKRLEEILNTKEEFPEATNTLLPVFENHISFDSVSFVYPHKNNYALKNISLHIPKKQIVALVGSSGAGKSSLIDLLLRLYSPTQGIISIDDCPIESYSQANWRALFGVVSQDSFLFNTTIEENIRFGRLDASDEAIVQAAQMAGADPFIRKLPQGYHTLVGEDGYRLSGGEKQRISLAQALIRDPEILVLDEATSHLDSSSEQVVQEALLRLRTRKTMLVVAHRLSTIQMADLIYVLENGRIIESGTHQELLHLGGRYQMFWHLQTVPSQKVYAH